MIKLFNKIKPRDINSYCLLYKFENKTPKWKQTNKKVFKISPFITGKPGMQIKRFLAWYFLNLTLHQHLSGLSEFKPSLKLTYLHAGWISSGQLPQRSTNLHEWEVASSEKRAGSVCRAVDKLSYDDASYGGGWGRWRDTSSRSDLEGEPWCVIQEAWFWGPGGHRNTQLTVQWWRRVRIKKCFFAHTK